MAAASAIVVVGFASVLTFEFAFGFVAVKPFAEGVPVALCL
jgi:hypothetical protein